MSLRIALAASLLSLASLSLGCGARSELDGLSPAEQGGGGEGGMLPQPKSCKEQGITYIYVVMEDKSLYAFDPPTGTFSERGALNCLDMTQAFSMAVDRKGVALVEFTPFNQPNGADHLYQVDTKNGECSLTVYQPDMQFDAFGMGYVANTNNGGETLYLASGDGVLATLDTKTFVRTEIGPFSKPLGEAELTGTADGRLWAFGFDKNTGTTQLAEVDPKTATVISAHMLPIGQNTSAWAFANWGADFYFFTTKNGVNSVVTKYDPATHVFSHVADAPGLIVGSGVSTCAPI
jgi:hypothetical protein